MSEVDPRSDGKNGASPPAGAPPSEPPPPSSRREFIGTNTDAAQAYVPPTALPETPEPPVPDTKIALADEVDPRKAPTHPNLRKAAQALASERPPPTVEAPPDSQVSGIRRGSGYAPSRSQFPQPAPSSPRLEALRQTPSKPPTKASLHKTPATPLSALRQTPSKPHSALRQTPPSPLSRSSLRGPSSESVETPQQRRAAIALIFVFAALLAVAVYFFLRRAPSPPGMDSGAPSASSGAPSSAAPPPSSATSTPAAIEPSSSGAAPANATPAPAATSSSEPFSNEPAPTARAAESASSAVTTTAPTASTQATPTASSTASPAVSGTGGKKSDRWF